jgi:FMN hydrolase / 5-amino-6-(5-phospho-D-ribitylamino)uracil phosphatase
MSSPVFLLDVMSTLVHEPFLHEVPAFLGRPLGELRHELSIEAWHDFEKGRLDEATFARRFFRDGRAFDYAGLVAMLRGAYRYLDGIEPLLGELRAAGHAMHALSNYPVWYQLIEEAVGLSRYVAWTFVSCRTGVRKPDPAAYRGAAEALGVAPAECIFVDDRHDNCDAARAVGMDAIVFEGAVALRRALHSRNLLPHP